MAKNYKQIIEDLEKAIADIEAKGISIEPLNKAIEELKSHSDNISAIEENIDAVKSEVITPIKTELEQNKKAGKFSIIGFYVGVFGLAVTAISLLYTTFKQPEQLTFQYPKDSVVNADKNHIPSNGNADSKYIPSYVLVNIENTLDEIAYSIHGLNEDYKPLDNEYLINQKEQAILLKNDSIIFSVHAYIPNEKKIKDRYYPMASLSFSINGKQLGTKGLKEMVKIINNSGVSHYYPNFNSIWITENDRFVIFGKHSYEITRIFREESQILTVADEKDAVLIKRIE
ncbi:MAG: hypothetical protein COA57_06215 [Flavobacteriales bacterium]|nr:MAG: hypothetical protein COA57_06215 [Flavobacteriales bacterium]